MLDNQLFEVINPRTGVTEIWNGERIKAYQRTYKVVVEFPKKKQASPKRTYKRKKS